MTKKTASRQAVEKRCENLRNHPLDSENVSMMLFHALQLQRLLICTAVLFAVVVEASHLQGKTYEVWAGRDDFFTFHRLQLDVAVPLTGKVKLQCTDHFQEAAALLEVSCLRSSLSAAGPFSAADVLEAFPSAGEKCVKELTEKLWQLDGAGAQHTEGRWGEDLLIVPANWRYAGRPISDATLPAGPAFFGECALVAEKGEQAGGSAEAPAFLQSLLGRQDLAKLHWGTETVSLGSDQQLDQEAAAMVEVSTGSRSSSSSASHFPAGSSRSVGLLPDGSLLPDARGGVESMLWGLEAGLLHAAAQAGRSEAAAASSSAPSFPSLKQVPSLLQQQSEAMSAVLLEMTSGMLAQQQQLQKQQGKQQAEQQGSAAAEDAEEEAFSSSQASLPAGYAPGPRTEEELKAQEWQRFRNRLEKDLLGPSLKNLRQILEQQEQLGDVLLPLQQEEQQQQGGAEGQRAKEGEEEGAGRQPVYGASTPITLSLAPTATQAGEGSSSRRLRVPAERETAAEETGAAAALAASTLLLEQQSGSSKSSHLQAGRKIAVLTRKEASTEAGAAAAAAETAHVPSSATGGASASSPSSSGRLLSPAQLSAMTDMETVLLESSLNAEAGAGVPGMDLILRPVMFGALKPVIDVFANMAGASLGENMQEMSQHK